MWRFSNSHLGDYFRCPRMRFLRYHSGGTGWVRKGINWDLLMGTFCHTVCCGVLRNEGLEFAIGAAQREFMGEVSKVEGANPFYAAAYQALGEALARDWVKIRLPVIQQYYEVAGVEQEYIVPLAGDVELMVRPDAELKRRVDGEIWALEFKTTGFNSVDYYDSWSYSTQTLTHCLGLDRKYGRQTMGVCMEFLYKGMKRKDQQGVDQFYSPLIRGYSAGPLPPFNSEYIQWDSSYARKKGYDAVNVWDKMGLQDWIDQLPSEVLEEQLATREIYRKRRELEIWQRQTLRLEQRIRDGAQWFDPKGPENIVQCDRAMDEVFPARLDRYCFSNEYRKTCPYLGVCFKGEEMSEENGFERRTPHHVGEFDE